MGDYERGWLDASNDYWSGRLKQSLRVAYIAARDNYRRTPERYQEGYFRCLEFLVHSIESPVGL
jgi:hypothetical protein